jgi:hypothetical protein
LFVVAPRRGVLDAIPRLFLMTDLVEGRDECSFRD